MIEAEKRHGKVGVTPMLRYRIAAARRTARLSKAQLARRLGVLTRVVVDWERGEKQPGPFQIRRLESVLHPGFGRAHIWLRGGTQSPDPATAEPSPTAMSETVQAYSGGPVGNGLTRWPALQPRGPKENR